MSTGQASTPARQLRPGELVSVQLGAGEKSRIQFSCSDGQYAEVFLTQTEGLLQISEIGGDGTRKTPRTLDAGKGASIRTAILCDRRANHTLEVSGYHANEAAAGSVHLILENQITSIARDRVHAEERLTRAEWSRRKGKADSWATAIADYGAAAALIDPAVDPDLFVEAWIGKSRLSLYRRNDYTTALACARFAVDRLDPKTPAVLQAWAWKALSSALYYVPDYSGSIASGKHALELYEQTGDLYWQGILLGNIANTYRETGMTAEALSFANRALELARQTHDQFGVIFTLESIGTIHVARGEMEAAIESYHDSLDELEHQPFPDEKAATWNGLGEVYAGLGDDRRAEECFSKSLETLATTEDRAGELRVLLNLGNVKLRSGETAQAITIFQQALQKSKDAGLQRERSFLLAALGEAQAKSGNPSAAETTLREALDLAQAIGQPGSEATARQLLGDLYASQDMSGEAIAQYTASRQLWQAELNRAADAISLASIARLRYAMGEYEEAWKLLPPALDAIESSRASITSDELRTSYFSSKHSIYDLAVATLLQLHRKNPRSGFDLQAFQVTERARSRTLLDNLQSAQLLRQSGVPAPLLEHQQKVREQLDAALWREREAERKGATQAQQQELHRSIQSLLSEEDDIDAQIRNSSGTLALYGTAAPWLKQLQTRLASNHAALAEFWVGDRAGAAWLITPTGIRAYSLPPQARISGIVASFRNALTARSNYVDGEDLLQRTRRTERADATSAALAGTLGRMLFPAGIPRCKKLFVVADGPLLSVPFAPLQAAVAGTRGGRTPLIESIEVESAISASALLIPLRTTAPKDWHIAVFANPVYSASDSRLSRKQLLTLRTKRTIERSDDFDSSSRQPLRSPVSAGLPALEASHREAMQIARLGGRSRVQVFEGFAASPEAVQALDWSRYNVLHFATHAVINTEVPEMSGVLLSTYKPDGKTTEGMLWQYDISHMRVPVPLVVLNGCRTAEGKPIPGEGLAGLARAFFLAGAGKVMGTLWSVQDEAASYAMQSFYSSLLQGHTSSASALRKAQLGLLHDPRWRAPYFWAAYTLETVN